MASVVHIHSLHLIAILVGSVTVLVGLPSTAFAEGSVRADFNGDGFDDLAVRVPTEAIEGVSRAGAVNVI